MSDDKKSWDDIPSIEGLEVDWSFEPTSSLGRRAHQRITRASLKELLENKEIQVKFVTSTFEEVGYIENISVGGIAIIIDAANTYDTPANLGFFLGQYKIITKGLVRSSLKFDEGFRTGIKFIDLKEEDKEYIASLVTADSFKTA